jgi:hypothetical protein
MGLRTLCGKGPQLLLWACSRAACEKVTIHGTPNCLNYCETFIEHKKLRNVASGRITQPGGAGVRDLLVTLWILTRDSGYGYKNLISLDHKDNNKYMLLNTQRIIPNFTVTSAVKHVLI